MLEWYKISAISSQSKFLTIPKFKQVYIFCSVKCCLYVKCRLYVKNKAKVNKMITSTCKALCSIFKSCIFNGLLCFHNCFCSHKLRACSGVFILAFRIFSFCNKDSSNSENGFNAKLSSFTLISSYFACFCLTLFTFRLPRLFRFFFFFFFFFLNKFLETYFFFKIVFCRFIFFCQLFLHYMSLNFCKAKACIAKKSLLWHCSFNSSMSLNT